MKVSKDAIAVGASNGKEPIMKMAKTKWAVLLASVMVSVAITAQSAHAVVAYPTLARTYITWFARAFDQCSPLGLSVTSANVPTTGCLSANSVTDSLLNFRYARLFVNSRGRVVLFGAGFGSGDRVDIRLTLRVTRKNTNTKHPPGVNTVTFADYVAVCTQSPYGFVANPAGGLVGITSLGSCTSPNTALGNPATPKTLNIEIVHAELLNHDNGKAFAQSGLER